MHLDQCFTKNLFVYLPKVGKKYSCTLKKKKTSKSDTLENNLKKAMKKINSNSHIYKVIRIKYNMLCKGKENI